MVEPDLPTREEFEEAQEAHANGEVAEGFHYGYRADRFEDYTEFLATLAVSNAKSAASESRDLRRRVDQAETVVKILLLSIGTAAVIEKVIGDARL